MPGVAEWTGWSISSGWCWASVQCHWVVLGLRAVPKEEAGVSAAEARYGHSLMLPSQLQPPPCAPQAAPAKVDIPSTVKPAREAEKTREMGVQLAYHIYCTCVKGQS